VNQVPNRPDQTADQQYRHRQKAQTVSETALPGVQGVGRRIDLPTDEVDDAQPRGPQGAEISAEQVNSWDETDQLLQRILLNSEKTLEYFISRGGRRLHPVLPARLAHLEAEHDELENCEHSHDIDISHGASLFFGGF